LNSVSKKELVTMGLNGQKIIASYYDKDSVTTKYVKLVDAILK